MKNKTLEEILVSIKDGNEKKIIDNVLQDARGYDRYYKLYLENKAEKELFINNFIKADDITVLKTPYKNLYTSIDNLELKKAYIVIVDMDLNSCKIINPLHFCQQLHISMDNLLRTFYNSKFHEGDWIVSNDSTKREVVQITDIQKDGSGYYIIYQNSNITEKRVAGEWEKDYHLWTIKDAEEYDILQYKNKEVFMFKEIKGDDVLVYCKENLYEGFEYNSKYHGLAKVNDLNIVQPACDTYEQELYYTIRKNGMKHFLANCKK